MILVLTYISSNPSVTNNVSIPVIPVLRQELKDTLCVCAYVFVYVHTWRAEFNVECPKDPPVSVSPLLGLQVCTPTPRVHVGVDLNSGLHACKLAESSPQPYSKIHVGWTQIQTV